MSASNIHEMIDGAKAGNLDAARQLADAVAEALRNPNKRIGSFFTPKRRGGDYAAANRAERNQAYKELAQAEFGRLQLTPNQTKLIARKVQRMFDVARKVEGESDLAQDAINRIAAAGLCPLSPRRLYDVLNDQGN